MSDHLSTSKSKAILQFFLLVFAIPHVVACVQVDISLGGSGDNTSIVQEPYIFDKDDPILVPASPLCPLTTPLVSYKQRTGVWCWAASAQMAINYLRAINSETPISQCEIANTMLNRPPTPGIDCCKAEDDYAPTTPDPEVGPSRTKCIQRMSPSDALEATGYAADKAIPPLKWQGLSEQLCTKRIPYISVVRFYDNNGSLSGRHSSVIGGGRVMPDGEQYVEVTDHSEDDFFVMKWIAFESGVQGDFVHDYDYVNLRKLP